MNQQENNNLVQQIISDKEVGFTRECVTLKEKRARAIAYLGQKWLLHPQCTFVPTPSYAL